MSVNDSWGWYHFVKGRLRRLISDPGMAALAVLEDFGPVALWLRPRLILGGLSFEGQGSFPSQRCVFASRVIEAIDIFEDGDFSGSACLPRVPPNQFGFNGLEEAFHCGVIIAIPLAAHRHLEAVLARQLLIVM